MGNPDFSARRDQMLERDLRQRGVDDPRLLAAFAAVPREVFVPTTESDNAYRDRAVPLGSGQTVSQPFVVAVMLDVLKLTDECRLLEVGSGSGYAAAVAAQLVAEVIGLERIGSLAEDAVNRLAGLNIDNVEIHHADGHPGWAAGAPYDAILISAATQRFPSALVDQLADGGRIIAPIGDRGWGQKLIAGIKRGEELESSNILDVAFVPLLSGQED
jgi:protein-L-isoaspartate(D-aspartate) O-methyltransferase